MHLVGVARLPSETIGRKADIQEYGLKELVDQKMVVVAEE
jgi:hypothetical protein